MAPMVYEYQTRKTLSKIGFSFDDSELYDFDVQSFRIIESEFARMEREELKRQNKSKRK